MTTWKANYTLGVFHEKRTLAQRVKIFPDFRGTFSFSITVQPVKAFLLKAVQWYAISQRSGVLGCSTMTLVPGTRRKSGIWLKFWKSGIIKRKYSLQNKLCSICDVCEFVRVRWGVGVGSLLNEICVAANMTSDGRAQITLQLYCECSQSHIDDHFRQRRQKTAVLLPLIPFRSKLSWRS